VVLMSACAMNSNAQPANGVNYSANAPVSSVPSAPVPPDSSWPMRFNGGNTAYLIYQPQCDSWDGHQLMGRSAVAVQPAGQSQPTYGVVTFNAITLVDKSTRAVTLANFTVTGADFPSAHGKAQNYMASIVQNLPSQAPTLTLDVLENNLSVPAP